MTQAPAMLDGKVAIVTAAGKNIGRDIALTLAGAGAKVVVNGLSNQALIDGVAGEIRDAGGEAISFLGDMSKEADVERLMATTLDAFGAIDIVVSNAGLRRQIPAVDMSFAEWREVLSVALDGAFLLAHYAGPHLLKGDYGRFVAISGTSHHMGVPNRVHVSASKSGLEGLCRSLASEWGPHGVTANSVAPGATDTERGPTAGKLPANMSDNDVPLRRKARTSEIAGAVLYLCSPAGAYVTGQVIHVNGGLFYGH